VRINGSEYSNFDSAESVPPVHIYSLWLQHLPVPSVEESHSIFLAAQYLFLFLESYGHDRVCSNATGTIESFDPSLLSSEIPFNSEEASSLRSLSISLQIYCERIRLIFFASISPSTFGNRCQFCGHYDISHDQSLKFTCSSCSIATDTCMYIFLPINFSQEQSRVLMKCQLCEACSIWKMVQGESIDFGWLEIEHSFMRCLFCSSSLAAI
jgi:hypothetical protein